MMRLRKAFTLMEINLAILVMAGGVLSVLGLFSLGYRENRQSAEDVASAAYADAVFAPLVTALSATNLSWSTFKDLKNYPGDTGWASYLNNDGTIKNNPESIAQSAFSTAMSKLSAAQVNAQWPTTAAGGLMSGLVILHEQDSAIVRIGFRASKQKQLFLAAPLYYTEVRFQGDPNK